MVSDSIKYYVTEVSEIGSVPVYMSVSNLTSGSVDLTANPLGGSWTVKFIRMIV